MIGISRRAWLAAGLAVAALALATPLAAQWQRPADPRAHTEIWSRPIEAFHPREPERKQFGALEFRGGLELTSPNKNFGGLSGLVVAPDGERFIAVTDKSFWLRGRIVYRDGAPSGIADAEIAPMLGPDGRTLAARGWYDTESLTADGGIFYAGIERVNQIVRFDFGKDGFAARGEPVAAPPEIGKLPNNKGLECIAFAGKGTPLAGTLIAVSERGLDAENNIQAFLIGGPRPGNFSVRRIGDFDISDCTVTPDNDLLLLERAFSWRRGVAMRLRRVHLADLKPGIVADGAVLFEADLAYNIDNMEGLSVHRAADGTLVLTIVSDDNFSPLQRTILLQFTLLDR